MFNGFLSEMAVPAPRTVILVSLRSLHRDLVSSLQNICCRHHPPNHPRTPKSVSSVFYRPLHKFPLTPPPPDSRSASSSPGCFSYCVSCRSAKFTNRHFLDFSYYYFRDYCTSFLLQIISVLVKLEKPHPQSKWTPSRRRCRR